MNRREEGQNKLTGKLYVVGTPIGNLSDMSPRGIETLKNVDFIAAEDTRVTLKLLSRFDIKKPMVSYFEHNKAYHGDMIISRIENGENCAIVTDAGMPAISDPGEDLVKTCHDHGIEVISVPGPSAVTTALAVSGISSGRFCFEGFLSVNKKSRFEHLNSLIKEKRTMVFYEAPHKLLFTLKDLFNVFGDRKISIVRELTKIHEEIMVTVLSDAIKHYSENNPKGEFVLVIEGCKNQPDEHEYTIDEAVAIAKDYMTDGMSASSAAKTAASETGFKKSEIYPKLN